MLKRLEQSTGSWKELQRMITICSFIFAINPVRLQACSLISAINIERLQACWRVPNVAFKIRGFLSAQWRWQELERLDLYQGKIVIQLFFKLKLEEIDLKFYFEA